MGGNFEHRMVRKIFEVKSCFCSLVCSFVEYMNFNLRRYETIE